MARGFAETTLPTAYNSLSLLFDSDIDQNEGLTAFRSLLIPMGGLAEGMGQAATALAFDSSSFEANPAASCVLDQTELAVYNNNWIADTRISSAVYTIRHGNLGLGIGGKWLYLEFPQTDEYGTLVSDGYYSEAIGALNVSYNFFQGYNFSGLCLGATLKGAYRSVPPAIEAIWHNSAGAVMADLGALVRFNFLKFYSSRNKNFSFGLAAKNLGPPVFETNPDPLPTVFSAGIAYSPIKPLTLSFDVSKPVNLSDPSVSELMSWAFGIEGNLTDFFKLEAGFLLKGGNPRIALGTTFDVDLIRLAVNYTLDLTTQMTAFDRISVEASFSLGDLGRADLAKKVDNLYLSGLEAYARGDSAAAAIEWREALSLDPHFDPARESLKALEGTQDLLRSIDALQKLD